MSNPNAVKVYNDLRGLGLSEGAAEGVVGNLVAESGVNPTAQQKGGAGTGIAQWSRGGRWDQLVAWATRSGRNPWALDTQEAWMVSEMQSSGVWAQLQHTGDVGAAAYIVMRGFEMPKDQSVQNAQARAQLGLKAVGKDGGPLGLGGVLNAASGPAGAVKDAVTQPFADIAGAISGAEQGAVKGLQHIVLIGAFVTLAAALVAGGLWKATAGPRQKAAEGAQTLAPLVAAAA